MSIFNNIRHALGFGDTSGSFADIEHDDLMVSDDDRPGSSVKPTEARADTVCFDSDTDTINRLKTELERLREKAGEAESLNDKLEKQRLSFERQKRAMSDRILDLQDQVANLEARLSESGSGIEKSLPGKSADYLSEIERLKILNEQLDAKSRISDNMLSQLNRKLSQATNENRELSKELEAAMHLQNEIPRLQEMLERKNGQIKELQSRIKADETGDGNKGNVSESESKLLARIHELELHVSESDSLRERIKKLKADRETLRKTVETNLYNQAHSEARLRGEIKRLRRKYEPDKLESDDDRPRKGSRKRAQQSDDFGYQEPERGKRDDNPAQMSLFD
jgi:chromosome segregation ATPase